MTQEQAQATLESVLSSRQQARLAALAAARKIINPQGVAGLFTGSNNATGNNNSLDPVQTINIMMVAEWILDEGDEPVGVELPFSITTERHQFESLAQLRAWLRENAGPDCGNPDCAIHGMAREDNPSEPDRPLSEDERSAFEKIATEGIKHEGDAPEPPLPPVLGPEWTHKIKIRDVDDIYPAKLDPQDDDVDEWYVTPSGVRYRRINHNALATAWLLVEGVKAVPLASVEAEPTDDVNPFD